MLDEGLNQLPRSAEEHVDEPVRSLGRSAAIAALRRRFATLRPGLQISSSGHVSSLEDNLLPGVRARHFVEDFENGDGRELKWKFRAIHSSAALAVNAFGRFKDEPAELPLAGVTNFETIAFEGKCPTGLRGGRPAHLDLLAQSPASVVAVESKCTEHLEPKEPRFSPAYAEQIYDHRRASPWFRAMEAIRDGIEIFGFLDAAQLIKHAFGLAHRFKEQPVTLLYLYWEPLDGDRHAVILAHRREVARFAQVVAGGVPLFRAQSYLDLWDAWQRSARPSWLMDHLVNLRARYAASLGDGRLG